MPPPKSLTQVLKAATKPKGPPVWKGPEVDGITLSMLSRFLTCRERFRVAVIEGLKSAPAFTPVLEYGQMWHACEEAYAADVTDDRKWRGALRDYIKGLCLQFPLQREEINNWGKLCEVQFPHYVRYWADNPDVQAKVPVAQESSFDVKYPLPSGRVVRLRGKRDSIDFLPGKGLVLQENKTKSQIDRVALSRQLTADLQTNIYLVSIKLDKSGKAEWLKPASMAREPIHGVRYNVVKRPGQRQGKKESVDQFIKRVGETIRETPSEFFARWDVPISAPDLARFEKRTLVPLLEHLCEWYDHVTCDDDPWRVTGESRPKGGGGIHWQHPLGVRNILDEGGSTDLDHYLATGSTVGLVKVDRLFEEL